MAENRYTLTDAKLTMVVYNHLAPGTCASLALYCAVAHWHQWEVPVLHSIVQWHTGTSGMVSSFNTGGAHLAATRYTVCLRRYCTALNFIPYKPAAQAAGADPPPASPIGQIHPFSKMAVTFEPRMGFTKL